MTSLQVRHPLAVRGSRNARNLHSTGLEVEHEEHRVADEPTPSDDFDCEEVRRGDYSPMRLDNRRSRHSSSLKRDAGEAVLEKDSLDRISASLVANVVERALDPCVT
jgi:hypothetical protein